MSQELHSFLTKSEMYELATSFDARARLALACPNTSYQSFCYFLYSNKPTPILPVTIQLILVTDDNPDVRWSLAYREMLEPDSIALEVLALLIDDESTTSFFPTAPSVTIGEWVKLAFNRRLTQHTLIYK